MKIEITRIFNSPPARVWRAWTNPDELVCWWGKRGWTAQRETLVMDLRPGGSFRVTAINDDDGRTQITEGVYLAIDPPHTLAWDGATVTFTDLGDGRTRMDFQTTLDAPVDVCDAARGGLRSAHDRLEEHLSRKAPA
jgi:uncharacterized protein YndB with AHSA1/START domain